MEKLLYIIMLAVGFSLQAEDEPQKKRPNILILLADDMGYGELGCYGQKIIKTPTLDALAAKGLRFTDFYAGNAVCSASRAVLMTGIHAGHSSIRGNKGFIAGNEKWGRMALKKSEVTLGEMLQGAGYQTAFIGKWHLGVPQDPSTWAHARGFEYAVQEQGGERPEGGSFEAGVHLVNGRESELFYDYKKYDCIDVFRTDLALDFLDEQRNKEKPLFLFMSYRSPHSKELELREKVRYKEYAWPEVERRHASRISMLDEQVKRLLDKLELMGELNNTFIMFASDNGPHNALGHDYTFFKSSGGLKGYKRDMYEGGLRVPGIVYWPGKSRSGEVSSHKAAFQDVMATLAELAEIEPPKQSEGISFIPEILGKKQAKHKYLYWEIQDCKKAIGSKKLFHRAVLKGPWKAVRYGDKNKTELYHLGMDLYETKDLADEYPEILDQMNKLLSKESSKNENYPYSGPLK